MTRRTVFFVGVATIFLLFVSMAPAQAPRPRLGGGLRGPDRDRQAEREKGPLRPVTNRPRREPADTSPAAETYRKGADALDKGDTDAAIALLAGRSNSIQICPGLLRPWTRPDDEGRTGQGRGRFDDRHQVCPHRRPLLFQSRLRLLPERRLRQGMADYTEAIRLHPDYAAAYRDRGYVRTLKGDMQHAFEDLNMAVKLAEGSAAYISPAKAFSEMGDWDHAVADYSQAIDLQPKDVDVVRSQHGPYDEGRLRCRDCGRRTGDQAGGRAGPAIRPWVCLSQARRVGQGPGRFRRGDSAGAAVWRGPPRARRGRRG